MAHVINDVISENNNKKQTTFIDRVSSIHGLKVDEKKLELI